MERISKEWELTLGSKRQKYFEFSLILSIKSWLFPSRLFPLSHYVHFHGLNVKCKEQVLVLEQYQQYIFSMVHAYSVKLEWSGLYFMIWVALAPFHDSSTMKIKQTSVAGKYHSIDLRSTSQIKCMSFVAMHMYYMELIQELKIHNFNDNFFCIIHKSLI